MARGWESKSVEAQIDSAENGKPPLNVDKTPDPAYLELIRRRENLELSRTRVLRDLEASQNPRYKQILTNALADLNHKLSELSKTSKASAAHA
jgi:hypothetical protein